MNKKILYLESVAGIAGDMFAASFVDAGLVRFEDLESLPRELELDGVVLQQKKVVRALMKATHVEVVCSSDAWKKRLSHSLTAHAFVKTGHAKHLHSDHWHSHYSDIDLFLANAPLSEFEKNFSRKVFRLIAEAEATAHGMSVEEVAFHEVGTIDSILDVIMAARCIEQSGASRFVASPVKLGRGTIKIQHGIHAVPPPASALLVRSMQISPMPQGIERANVELSTPTGLAILKALEVTFDDAWPDGCVLSTGMGAGTMEFEAYPNVFRVTLIEENAAKTTVDRFASDRVVEIVLNLDDQTAERTAWAVEQLIERGALDVWQTAISGKKGRLATQLSVLCDESRAKEFIDWLLVHTSTFGVRFRTWDRKILSRRIEEREMADGRVRVKIGTDLAGAILKEKVEFDDWRRNKEEC